MATPGLATGPWSTGTKSEGHISVSNSDAAEPGFEMLRLWTIGRDVVMRKRLVELLRREAMNQEAILECDDKERGGERQVSHCLSVTLRKIAT